ncbi:MAG: energy-coupling factor transporter transmembrane component T [Betaproteobacteria bacterium]
MTSAIHPTTRLVLWLIFLVAVQTLRGTPLLCAVLLMPVLGLRILQRGWKLIRRTRWLLLSLFVILAWGSAGEPLWNSDTAPTYEGLSEALTHLGRLILVLMAVAAFLETMPLPDLLAGARTLFKPLRHCGLDPDRGIVRLMLVLRYVETLPNPKDWRSVLNAPATTECELIEVNDQPLRWSDYTLAALGVLALIGLFFV